MHTQGACLGFGEPVPRKSFEFRSLADQPRRARVSPPHESVLGREQAGRIIRPAVRPPDVDRFVHILRRQTAGVGCRFVSANKNRCRTPARYWCRRIAAPHGQQCPTPRPTHQRLADGGGRSGRDPAPSRAIALPPLELEIGRRQLAHTRYDLLRCQSARRPPSSVGSFCDRNLAGRQTADHGHGTCGHSPWTQPDP